MTLAGTDSVEGIGLDGKTLEGEFSVLLVGSDSRAGSVLDDGEEGELNDVNLLLHVSADHQNATVIQTLARLFGRGFYMLNMTAAARIARSLLLPE